MKEYALFTLVLLSTVFLKAESTQYEKDFQLDIGITKKVLEILSEYPDKYIELCTKVAHLSNGKITDITPYLPSSKNDCAECAVSKALIDYC